LRILYFTRNDSAHDRRFLKALASTENEIFALRMESYEQLPYIPEGVQEIKWRGCQGKFKVSDSVFLLPKFQRIVNEIKPDVIHAGPIQDVAFLTAASGYKSLISMSWGFDLIFDANTSPLMQWVTSYTLKRSKKLIVDCQTVLNKALTYGFTQNKIVNFPWGVDINKFSKTNGQEEGLAWRKRMGWEDKKIFLGLRSWEPSYGMDILAEAFIIAANKNPDLRMILLGSGSQEKKIKKVILESNVKNRVYIGERVDEDILPGIYCSADVYVSPSHVDGSSVSLLEAMACELPSIVSDIESNKEWITENGEGWIFRDGDSNHLAELMLNVSKHRNFRQLGSNARKVIVKRANWNKNIQHLFDAYDQMVDEKL
jgi:glycosyltransferase involved in cell wall biosynthesis